MLEPENLIRFADREGWREWLVDNHAVQKDAWLILVKRKPGLEGLTLAEAVEEALCFGWVDSLLATRDESTYVLRFTPRKPGSNWSKVNRERVARLTEQGRMAEAGLAAVRAAKEEGGWERLREFDLAVDTPAELAEVFKQNPVFKARFLALAPSRQKAFLNWLNLAKTSESRTRRAGKVVEMVADQEKGRK